MKLESEVLLDSATISTDRSGIAPRLPFFLLASLLVWMFGWHWTTVASIESIWAQNSTFQHGYLIVPISLWLIWRRRQLLKQIPWTPVFWPLVFLALLGFVWLLAHLAAVVVIRQYAFVLMVPVIVTALFGSRFAWALAFPLAFLMLAVPFGEILIPPMINFTADFTVSALRLSGIPVFREGAHFSLPSGNWSVVEACSGLRYLIASFTLGCLYAYLNYRSLRYRLIFIALSLVVPVLANGLRAYSIVMLGHLSNMQLAVGVDHLIYGWLFFGVVIMLLFWAGSFWREDTDSLLSSQQRGMALQQRLQLPKLLCATCLSAIVIALWPAYAALVESPLNAPTVRLAVPKVTGWQRTNQRFSSWHPHYLAARAQVDEVFEKDGRAVGLFIGYYNNQNETVKLVSSTNALTVTTNKFWSTVSEETLSLSSGEGSITVHQSKLRGPETTLRAWHWFWVKGVRTGSPYLVKMLQAGSRFLGRGDDSAVIILYTPTEERIKPAEAILREFFGDALPAIERTLNDANHE